MAQTPNWLITLSAVAMFLVPLVGHAMPHSLVSIPGQLRIEHQLDLILRGRPDWTDDQKGIVRSGPIYLVHELRLVVDCRKRIHVIEASNDHHRGVLCCFQLFQVGRLSNKIIDQRLLFLGKESDSSWRTIKPPISGLGATKSCFGHFARTERSYEHFSDDQDVESRIVSGIFYHEANGQPTAVIGADDEWADRVGCCVGDPRPLGILHNVQLSLGRAGLIVRLVGGSGGLTNSIQISVESFSRDQNGRESSAKAQKADRKRDYPIPALASVVMALFGVPALMVGYSRGPGWLMLAAFPFAAVGVIGLFSILFWPVP